MNCVEITSLPDILFSHIYKADHYHNSFAVRESFLEVSYIADGSFDLVVGNERFCAKKGDILCLFYDQRAVILTDKFHSHHTIGVKVDWNFSSDERGLLLPIITPAKNKNLPSELLYAQRAKDYIQRNILSCITQNSVAAYLGISPEYLCTVFKKAEGTTVIKYINKLKLESIKTLIANTNMHLYEAAALYGYNDPNYVSRLHKQLFGYNITDKPYVHPEIE